MWDNLVSIANVMLARAVARFVEVFWYHPVAGACFLAGFSVLTILLWLEVLQERADRSNARAALETIRPIRIWR